MKRAVLYARVSTEGQRERHTIASQLSLLPELIKQKGYTQVAEPYVDDGISGETIEDRPAMSRLLEDAERQRFDFVFVIDIDRLTRSRKSIDWEIIKDAFRKGRVKLVTPSQEYDFENEDQEFISDLFSRISAYEKKKILRRMMRGKWEKTRQGKFVGGKLPFGYTFDETTRQYHVVEKEAEVIRFIFQLCYEGYSLERIQDRLNTLGYPSPVDVKGYGHRRKSNQWAKSSIRRILTKSMYMGEYERWTLKGEGRNGHQKRPQSEWMTAKVPAIISQIDFANAQEALKARKVLAKRNAKRPYLLSGLLYCSSCGSKMTGECYSPSKKHRRYRETRYYVCWNARRKVLDQECPTRSIKAETIENVVWEEVRKLLKTPTLLKQAILRTQMPLGNPNEGTLEILTRLMENKETEEERLLDLYQMGTVNKDKLEQRLEAVRKERETIRQNIDLLKNRAQLGSRLKTIQELSLELKVDLDTFDFARKQRVLKLLFWGQTGIGIFLNQDHLVELKGLVDVTRLQESANFGIENTMSC